MAYIGELVRMENGRWARYQECRIYKGQASLSALPILVAVELDDASQQALRDLAGNEEFYRREQSVSGHSGFRQAEAEEASPSSTH